MSLLGYADSYRQAAESLYQARWSAGGTDNLLLFPLAFLWRHHIELTLKGITLQIPGSDWLLSSRALGTDAAVRGNQSSTP
jgi:hypothetical protein